MLKIIGETLIRCQMPEAFNVFDAQVAQQRLQAGMTTLVSSKEVLTTVAIF